MGYEDLLRKGGRSVVHGWYMGVVRGDDREATLDGPER
jgi:hypothetical protein